MERLIDANTFPRSMKTEIFNGYGNEVAGLYKGMDLSQQY